MIANVRAPRQVFNQTLNSISDVISGEDVDRPLDLNLVARPDVIEVYVRQFNALQVMHKLTNGGDVEINVENENEFVFSSETLASIIKRTKSQNINLRFDHDGFHVEVQDGWFTTPTKFDLPMYKESEFSEPIRPTSFEKVGVLNPEALRDNLRMMEPISPDVVFQIEPDELWITVSDQVQGDGEVMQEINSGSELVGLEFRYEIEAIEQFLKNLEEDEVLMKMNSTGSLLLSTQSEGYISQLLISPRQDSQK
jgi:hypothetical protein